MRGAADLDEAGSVSKHGVVDRVGIALQETVAFAEESLGPVAIVLLSEVEDGDVVVSQIRPKIRLSRPSFLEHLHVRRVEAHAVTRKHESSQLGDDRQEQRHRGADPVAHRLS